MPSRAIEFLLLKLFLLAMLVFIGYQVHRTVVGAQAMAHQLEQAAP